MSAGATPDICPECRDTLHGCPACEFTGYVGGKWKRADRVMAEIAARRAAEPAKPPKWTWGDVRELLACSWRIFGTYNTDPYIARISIYNEAMRQLELQRQISEQHRVEDRLFMTAQSRVFAADMVEAMAQKIREERGYPPS